MEHQTLPITITGPRKQHAIFAAIAGIGLLVGYLRFNLGTPTASSGDYLILGVLAAIFALFVYRLLNPVHKIRFTDHGIWTTAHGHQPWENLGGVALEVQRGYKGIAEPTLLLLFDYEEMATSKAEVAYRFSDLSINEQQFRQMLEGPLGRHIEL